MVSGVGVICRFFFRGGGGNCRITRPGQSSSATIGNYYSRVKKGAGCFVGTYFPGKPPSDSQIIAVVIVANAQVIFITPTSLPPQKQRRYSLCHQKGHDNTTRPTHFLRNSLVSSASLLRRARLVSFASWSSRPLKK